MFSKQSSQKAVGHCFTNNIIIVYSYKLIFDSERQFGQKIALDMQSKIKACKAAASHLKESNSIK